MVQSTSSGWTFETEAELLAEDAEVDTEAYAEDTQRAYRKTPAGWHPHIPAGLSSVHVVLGDGSTVTGNQYQVPALASDGSQVAMQDAVMVLARAAPTLTLGTLFTGTSAQDIINVTVPGGVLTGRMLRWTVIGQMLLHNATSGNRLYRVRVYFGGVLIYDDTLAAAPTSSASPRVFMLMGMIGSYGDGGIHQVGGMIHLLGNVSVPTVGQGRLQGTLNDPDDIVGTIDANVDPTVDRDFQLTITMPVNSAADTACAIYTATLEIV